MSTLPTTAIPTEAEELRWAREPAFFRPHHNRGVAGIAPTLLRILGCAGAEGGDLRGYLPPDSPRQARRVFLLCLDGLGFHELTQAERLQRLYQDWGTWITSVFPSITSTAITSIYQGLSPARHGVLGHHIWKDHPGAVVDMLRMQVVGAETSLAAAGFDVRRWQREPGYCTAVAEMGLETIQLMPTAIIGSGLSTYSYGDARLVGFLEPMEGFAKAAHLLGEVKRGWVGMYLPTVDSLTHAFGTGAEPTRQAIHQLEAGLAWMTSQLRPDAIEDTVLMLVTDHGQCDIRKHVYLEGPAWDKLEGLARAIGFSGRVMHLYLDDPEHQATAALGSLAELMGPSGRAFLFDDVRELVGHPADTNSPADQSWVRQSLGDIVAILHEDIGWHQPQREVKPFPYGTPLVAQHGGLSRGELFVPLIVSPLASLLTPLRV